MSDHPWRKQRHHIKCCEHCVPPKRKPGCGADCPEYKAEKAQYLADIKKEKERRSIEHTRVTDYDFNRRR